MIFEDAFTASGSAGVTLSVTRAGEGRPILLLHGLTATSRYVVMGSRLLELNSCDVVAYDARGHGRSGHPADRSAYSYDELVDDAMAVMDSVGWPSATLVGISMGAHTAAALALRQPERVDALALITPAFSGGDHSDPESEAYWDALESALRDGDVEAFTAASGVDHLDSRFRETARKAVSQRMAQHQDLSALADALHVVPRSRPFSEIAQLEAISVPSLVIGSLDDADPTHPLEVAQDWSNLIPGARFAVEAQGESPLAWRGGSISRLILELIR